MYCGDFKTLMDGRGLCITKEQIMKLVDYDREEAIRSGKANFTYFLILLRNIPSSFIFLLGP